MTAPQKHAEQQGGIHPAGGDFGNGNARAAKTREKRQCQRDVHDNRNRRENHWRTSILAREEARNKGLDEHESRQAQTVDAKNLRNGEGGRGREIAALVQETNDGFGHDEKSGRGGQGQEQHELDRAVLQASGLHHMAAAQRPRQFRQEHRGNSNADDAERQLIDSVRIGKRGYDAFAAGSDVGVDEQIDLGNAAGDGCRQGKDQKPLHVLGEPWSAETNAHAGIAHRNPDDGELHKTCRHHAP